MYAEIVAAVQSVQGVSAIISASKQLSNYNELVSAVSEVNTKLMAATTVALASQEQHALVLQRVRDLEEKLMQFEKWEEKAKNYSLREASIGTFIYAYTPVVESSNPRHWACAKCFQDRKISILQRQHPPAYVCNECDTKIIPRENGNLASIDSVYAQAHPQVS